MMVRRLAPLVFVLVAAPALAAPAPAPLETALRDGLAVCREIAGSGFSKAPDPARTGPVAAADQADVARLKSNFFPNATDVIGAERPSTAGRVFVLSSRAAALCRVAVLGTNARDAGLGLRAELTGAGFVKVQDDVGQSRAQIGLVRPLKAGIVESVSVLAQAPTSTGPTALSVIVTVFRVDAAGKTGLFAD